jgi:predicted DNA-binding protein (MmcQ/YjbR family)
MSPKRSRFVERLRSRCLSLPETRETLTWGHPNFRVAGKIFCAYEAYHGRPCVCGKLTKPEQALRVQDPRVFVAPYVGKHGWVGIWLDTDIPWSAVESLILRSYELLAPKRCLAELRGGGERARAHEGEGCVEERDSSARRSAARVESLIPIQRKDAMTITQPGQVIPERYRKALGASEPVAAMKKAHKRLRRILDGLSEKKLAKRPAPDKWSIKEVLAHLADGEVMIGSRLRLVAAMDRPTIVGYDQDAFVARLGVDRASAAELLEAFASMRALNVGLVERVPKSAWPRVGLHSERGEESFETMVRMYAGHDIVHEEQIRGILSRLAELKAAKRAAKKASKQSKSKGRRSAPRADAVPATAAAPEAAAAANP